MRVRVLIGIVAVLSLTVGVAMASHSLQRGAKASVKINGTYRHGSTKEVGVTGVLSTTKDCTPSRKITIYKKAGGRLRKKGAGTSFSTGRWEAKTGTGDDVAKGTYVAKVAAGKGRHDKSCDRDFSPPTKLP